MKKRRVLVCLFAAVALATAVFGCTKKGVSVKAESVDAAAQMGEDAAESLNVTVSIDGSKGEDKAISLKGQAQLAEGSSAFDALKMICDANDLEITGDPSYVETIGGLGEGSFGAVPCGWMFSVNGEYPNSSAEDCVLNDGDELIWEFVK